MNRVPEHDFPTFFCSTERNVNQCILNRVRVKSEKRSHSKCIGLQFVLCTTKKCEKRSHSLHLWVCDTVRSRSALPQTGPTLLHLTFCYRPESAAPTALARRCHYRSRRWETITSQSRWKGVLSGCPYERLGPRWPSLGSQGPTGPSTPPSFPLREGGWHLLSTFSF